MRCRACMTHGGGVEPEPVQPVQQAAVTLQSDNVALPMSHHAAGNTDAAETCQPARPQPPRTELLSHRMEDVTRSPAGQQKSSMLKQMHLDFGQVCSLSPPLQHALNSTTPPLCTAISPTVWAAQANFSAKTCKVCGMIYAPGEPADEKTHAAYHASVVRGFRFQVLGCGTPDDMRYLGEVGQAPAISLITLYCRRAGWARPYWRQMRTWGAL